MIRRWILYLAVLAGLTVFDLAYQDWFSSLALLGVLYLPVMALAVSLPAMLLTKVVVDNPAYLPLGTEQRPCLSTRGFFPAPSVVGKIWVTRVTTGENWRLKKNMALPTDHCGQLLCSVTRGRIFDYLGLFFLPIRKRGQTGVIVRPQPEKVDQLPQLERYISASWRPKAGGGFAENHELRLYRPGDNLTQIHWKLSAKTGKYIVREAMEPTKSRMILEMELRGNSTVLDKKFARLAGVSNYLLQRGLRHELRVLTGRGIVSLSVDSKQKQEEAIDNLLSMPPASPEAKMESIPAAWQYRIGGGDDDA